MAMKELPEAEIKVRQDTYASVFNSFISRLFYMSHDPSPVYLFDLWLMNGKDAPWGRHFSLLGKKTNRKCKICKEFKNTCLMWEKDGKQCPEFHVVIFKLFARINRTLVSQRGALLTAEASGRELFAFQQ